MVDNEAIPPPAVGIHLFPNPAMEILEVNFLHMDGRVKQLKVFDISGKQWLGIREVAGFQNEDKIDIDLLPPGVYYLDVSTELERVLERFVKL